jgi:ubiquitin-activating enzyme E1
VEVLKDIESLEEAIKQGGFHVVCQTEVLINGKIYDPSVVDQTCREVKAGFICSQTLGAMGYAFLDFGKEHVITDHDGEQTRQFIVTDIEKGPSTTVIVHDDKRHTYQEGDYVTFREVEGMTEINNTDPLLIKSTTISGFVLDLDSSAFSDYTRQGIVENVKVPKTV